MSGVLLGLPGQIKRILQRLRAYQDPVIPLQAASSPDAARLRSSTGYARAIAASHQRKEYTLGTSHKTLSYTGKGYVDFGACTGYDSKTNDGIGISITLRLTLDGVIVSTNYMQVYDSLSSSSGVMGVATCFPCGIWTNHLSVPMVFDESAVLECWGSRSTVSVKLDMYMNVVPRA